MAQLKFRCYTYEKIVKIWQPFLATITTCRLQDWSKMAEYTYPMHHGPHEAGS